MNDAELEARADRIFRDGSRPLHESQSLREVFTDRYEPKGGLLREARVDRAGGRLTDVPLLGKVSKNGRIYTTAALRDAVELYDGARFYLDHPTEREMEEREGVRSVRDLAGKIENPRVAGDQVRGDVVLLDVEPIKSLVLSLAEQAPELAGMSHRARGEVRRDDRGRQVVESIDKVFGLELVTQPATVGGLQEAFQRERRGGQRGFRPVTDEVVAEAASELFA